jgi:hypothetical protein
MGGGRSSSRHCEKRRDEAIRDNKKLDFFDALAMTDFVA